MGPKMYLVGIMVFTGLLMSSESQSQVYREKDGHRVYRLFKKCEEVKDHIFNRPQVYMVDNKETKQIAKVAYGEPTCENVEANVCECSCEDGFLPIVSQADSRVVSSKDNPTQYYVLSCLRWFDIKKSKK